VPTGSSFLSLCLSRAFHKEILRLDRLETTIADWVDPLHPRFCLSSCAFPFPKVDRCRHLIVSKEVLPFSDLRCTAFPTVSSASSHRQRFRSESRLADKGSQRYEFCACGTGMTDVSLLIFQVEVQKSRIQMIDAKAASN